jgi:glycosyltransferase involved in cell wall biosynthesis
LSAFDVSVILPCYNEAGYVQRAVETVREVLEQTRYSYEIIIAEDGSTDGTDKIAKTLSERFENVVWLHRDGRGGRGSAVAHAIGRSRADICGYIDVDLEIPAHYIPALILAIEKGADIATCVRVYKVNRYQFLRFPKLLVHYGAKVLIRRLLRIPLQDTEAGGKFFRKDRILPVLGTIKDGHWFWDTEILVRPYYEGHTIEEIPTLFIPDYSRQSTVNLLRDSLAHLARLLEFRSEIKRTYWNKGRC